MPKTHNHPGKLRAGETSRPLVEARTVCSRARTALSHGWLLRNDDRDAVRIAADLEEVVKILEKWDR